MGRWTVTRVGDSVPWYRAIHDPMLACSIVFFTKRVIAVPGRSVVVVVGTFQNRRELV